MKPRSSINKKRAGTMSNKNSVDKVSVKKQRYENYTIDEGINLIILNTKVEKARKNIFGNFLYKIDNNSHYEVKAILDLSDSESINIKQDQQKGQMKFELKLDPFISSENEVSMEIDHPGKFCEIQYLIGYRINANLTININFPSFEKQTSLIKKDIDIIKDLYEKSLLRFNKIYFGFYDHVREYSSWNSTKYFVDIYFPPVNNELEVEVNK